MARTRRKKQNITNELNVDNRTIFTHDNLQVLEGINTGSVDLIYLDPPFNSNANYSAPVGSRAAGASFKDMWELDRAEEIELEELADTDPGAYHIIQAAHEAAYDRKGSTAGYLMFMYPRLVQMHRILKSTGSLYLHCDQHASHYLKQLLDYIFGIRNFRNEVIWGYKYGSRSKKMFGKKHDVILYYVKDEKKAMFHEKEVRVPHEPASLEANYRHVDEAGRRYREGKWKNGKIYRYYADEGRACDDTWMDINALHQADVERIGYPTQKPLKLLERIIKASSNPGDVVLDPFAGCATACVQAEKLGRQWIGIDVSREAYNLVTERLRDEFYDGGELPDSVLVYNFDDPPKRTDKDPLPTSWEKGLKQMLYTGRCVGCEREAPIDWLEIDHIKPKSKGGTYESKNAQLLCSTCNRSKGNKTMNEWKAWKEERGK